MTNPAVASYNILNIIMTESSFKRETVIDFSRTQKPNVDVKSTYSVSADGNGIYCVVEVYYFATYEGETAILTESRISMGGSFIKTGESALNIETFGKINGPAIIFPFIREHLSSLSVRAGINPILLPPVNFEALSKQTHPSPQ